MQQPGTSEGTFQHSPHNAGPIRSAELAQRRGVCTQDPDEVLLRCLRTHAPGAFESLVERYMHRLLKTASRITKSHEEAEDVVQETFLTVYRHVAGFRGECKLSTWLTTITRNHALMVLRKKRHPVLSIDAASGSEGHTISTTLIATGSSPEDKCIDQQLLDRLLLSIERLPSHRRDIFECISHGTCGRPQSLSCEAYRFPRLSRDSTGSRETCDRSVSRQAGKQYSVPDPLSQE
jgi:RNA polymerase sigma-70 factor (ECF subfamily)